jgi:ribosomal protein S27AE/G:T-mismatch repair DNA endonuclease (very short patch repair protein)
MSDEKVIESVVSLYNEGYGCVFISKKLCIPKHNILKILNKKNIIRKKDRCHKLNYNFDGIFYSVNRKCPRCNQSVQTKSKDRTICCRNHYTKLNNKTLCRQCSFDCQIGNGNSFFGRKHTEESKNKISKSRKGKGIGENNSMYNPEHRKKASEKLKEKWDKGEMEHVRKIMSDKMKENIRQRKIKGFIKSKAEVEIGEFIKSLNFDIVSSYKVDTKIFDIYVPKLNLIIEYNGDYWHCNPKKYSEDFFNVKKGKTSKEIWDYDKLKLELVIKLGYYVEVVWESDYKKNKKIIKNIINTYDRRNKNAPEWSRQDSDSSTPI